jgi:diguanylate cyclase (GGDEF)-like protein
MVFGKLRAAASTKKEPIRVRLVEDNVQVIQEVRQALEASKRGKFVVETVTSSHELREHLARRAFKDDLTGLYSKSYFVEALKNEANRVKRYERHFSCMMLDLDDFALISGAHGQEAADAVLKHVAAVVRGSIRAGDIVARYGRDEFAVLLVETSATVANQVAERVRFEIAAQAVVVDGERQPITASIGMCVVNRQHHLEPDAILARAAEALQEAKATGKNRVRVQPTDGDPDEVEKTPVDLGQQSDVELA